MTPSLMLPKRYLDPEQLGEGATGTVWRVQDTALGMPVALKIVRPGLALHPRFRARFSREIALSASAVHPRMVPVLDHGRLPDGRPYVALALADRGSLGDLLRQGPPLRVALRVIDQVLDALGHLHASGVVHQDLKPENVLLHGDPEEPDAWVADLGAAGALSELAMDHRGISGTPRWMAPEQVLGRAQELGPWTDLFAVGLLLAEILGAEREPVPTGRGTTESVHLPDRVPLELAGIVRALLDADPRQRYDRAADVRRALQEASRDLDPAERVTRSTDAALLEHTTTFPEWMLLDGRETLSVVSAEKLVPGQVPRWNRVPPGPPPRNPPPVPASSFHVRSSLSLLALRDPPLHARDEQRRLLWDRARYVIASGQPQVVLVVGCSGAGRTRLVESVSRALDAGGWMEAITLRFHDPPGLDDGYRGAVQELLSPWNDTRFEAEQRLSRWLARDQQRSPSAVAGEAAVLARWCGYTRPDEPPVNAAVGLAFLYRHLDARAWRGGACLVLEDADLARISGDGLAICEALLERSVGERPVFVVATLSEEALGADPGLAERVAALEERGAVRVPISRLEPDDAARLLVEGYGLVPELARELAPRSGGNLTFLTLLVRDLAARRLLVPGPAGRWALDPGVDLAPLIPPDLAGLCARRVEGALSTADDPPAVAEALASVALAGPDAPVQVIRAVNQEGLDGLVATGLVRQQGRRLVFEHRGIRRAAEARARAGADTALLHRRLADAWDELGRFTGADVDLPLGYHRLHAGQADRAVTPLLRATRTAIRSGLADPGLRAARLSIEAADRSGVLMARVEARQREAEALIELSQPAAARARVQAARNLGRVDRLSLARLGEVEARASTLLGEVDEARRLLAAAELSFEATGDRQGLVSTALGEGALLLTEGRATEALPRYERALLLDRGGDATAEVRALSGLVECRVAARQLDTVERDLARLRQVARQSGDTRNIAQATYVAGLVHLQRHRLEEANQHFQTARALAATLGDDRLRLSCENELGEVYRSRGDLRRAWQAFDRAAHLAEGRGWAPLAAVARLNLALLELRERRADGARRQVDRVDALLHEHPRHWGWLVVGLVRALLAAEEGDEPRCRAWWAVAREHGIGRSSSPDLWLPLERLSTAALSRGWKDISRQASTTSQGPLPPDEEVSAEIEQE